MRQKQLEEFSALQLFGFVILCLPSLKYAMGKVMQRDVKIREVCFCHCQPSLIQDSSPRKEQSQPPDTTEHLSCQLEQFI
jgi:hypothetical protein